MDAIVPIPGTGSLRGRAVRKAYSLNRTVATVDPQSKLNGFKLISARHPEPSLDRANSSRPLEMNMPQSEFSGTGLTAAFSCWRASFRSEVLAEPCLFQDPVGGVPRLDPAVDGKVAHRLRAEPDLVVALAGSDKVAPCLSQDPFELGDKVRHGRADSGA